MFGSRRMMMLPQLTDSKHPHAQEGHKVPSYVIKSHNVTLLNQRGRSRYDLLTPRNLLCRISVKVDDYGDYEATS